MQLDWCTEVYNCEAVFLVSFYAHFSFYFTTLERYSVPFTHIYVTIVVKVALKCCSEKNAPEIRKIIFVLRYHLLVILTYFY